MSIGRNIRILRMTQDMPPRTLLSAVNRREQGLLNADDLAAIEAGELKPTVTQVPEIAAALGVSSSDLRTQNFDNQAHRR